ncbi:hypothetical protein BH18ACI4_BH18ACI4_22080 [soil metagenome]
MLNVSGREFEHNVLVVLAAPFQGAVLFVRDLIQGLRAKPLAPGYPLPHLWRWLS